MIPGVLGVRGVDRGGLDQGDGHRRPALLHLQAQRIGEALHRVLARRVVALQRVARVRQDAADVDEGAAAAAEVRQRGEAAVHDPPVVSLEEASRVLDGDLLDQAVHRDAGVVDPGVDPSQLGDHVPRHPLHGGMVGHVRDAIARASAAVADLLCRLIQVRFVARHQHHGGASRRGPSRGGETNPARGAGHHQNLLRQRLQLGFHVRLRVRGCLPGGGGRRHSTAGVAPGWWPGSPAED